MFYNLKCCQLMCWRKWEQQHQHAIASFFFCCLSNPRCLCVMIYWIVVEPTLFDWKWKSWFHLTIFLDWIGQQLEQPAGSDSSLCIYNNILMCPLWDHDICAVDFHKTVTSEKRLLISPWLKLLISDLFKESSLSWCTSIICFEKQTLRNKMQCFFRCSQVQ